jgi:peroxiredoxin
VNPSSPATTSTTPDPAEIEPAHADSDDAVDLDEHGRVGYGAYARYTPLALALIMIAGLMAIGIYRYGDDPDDDVPESGVGALIDTPAPDFSLSLLDGSTLSLADMRGQVVVLNFWATWCEPCKEEMRLFQELSEANSAGDLPFTIVGVGVKARDTPEVIADYTQSLGITYPIGYDGGGDSALVGPIESSFGTADFLPLTFIISPDGVIDHVQVGPYDDADVLRDDISAAANSD